MRLGAQRDLEGAMNGVQAADKPLSDLKPDAIPAEPASELESDPVLGAVVQALVNGHTSHQLMLMVGGVTLTGQVVSPETWCEHTSGSDPTLASVLSQARKGGDGLTPLARARLTYLRGRLQWGSGLSPEQVAEMRAAEAAEARQGCFIHMIDVTIVSGDVYKSVPQWRGRVDRIDGFSILNES